MSANAPKCSCSCNEESGPAALVYPCSGAADTGDGAQERGDGVALKRSERARRAGRPHRGRIAEQIADRAARQLEAENVTWMSYLAGFTNVRHVRVIDLGFKKGKTPASDEAIRRVADAGAALLKE
jgi:uncharacterized metal-binding protein